MVQAISRWLLTAEAPASNPVSPFAVCGSIAILGKVFLRVFHRQHHSVKIPYSFIYHRRYVILVADSVGKSKILKRPRFLKEQRNIVQMTK